MSEIFRKSTLRKADKAADAKKREQEARKADLERYKKLEDVRRTKIVNRLIQLARSRDDARQLLELIVEQLRKERGRKLFDKWVMPARPDPNASSKGRKIKKVKVTDASSNREAEPMDRPEPIADNVRETEPTDQPEPFPDNIGETEDQPEARRDDVGKTQPTDQPEPFPDTVGETAVKGHVPDEVPGTDTRVRWQAKFPTRPDKMVSDGIKLEKGRWNPKSGAWSGVAPEAKLAEIRLLTEAGGGEFSILPDELFAPKS